MTLLIALRLRASKLRMRNNHWTLSETAETIQMYSTSEQRTQNKSQNWTMSYRRGFFWPLFSHSCKFDGRAIKLRATFWI